MANRKYKNVVQERKAHAKTNREYKLRSMKTYCIRFHKESDADVIAKLDATENKPAYIRRLVRKDLGD